MFINLIQELLVFGQSVTISRKVVKSANLFCSGKGLSKQDTAYYNLLQRLCKIS